MAEILELSNPQLAVPQDVELTPTGMLLGETATDARLADLTAAVDGAYAEAGLEDALAQGSGIKRRGTGDGLGREK